MDNNTCTVLVMTGFFALLGFILVMIIRLCKPKPAPWDGVHRIKYVKFVEDCGNSPDDYRSGWAWACTCGARTPSLATRLVYTEAHAVVEFQKHKALYTC